MARPYTLIERLANHLQRPVDDVTRKQGRLHLPDWLACVAGARKSEVAASLRSMPCDAVSAAAFLGNAQEMEDMHRTSLLHPGSFICPTALNSQAGSMDALLIAQCVVTKR